MLCAKCNSDIPVDALFCMKCGARVEIGCAACGTINPSDANFCRKCGASLGAAAPTHSLTEPSNDLAGERRHLTVLFCDLVGSTEIASRLDPEEWRDVVANYHRAAAQAIERFGGSVAQYLGDGVMAYFGYPEAHDNDAERAARAGLAILHAVSKLNEQTGRPKLLARIGIDSGSVVVGTGSSREADVFGDTPNIAARVQSAAEPGTVVITDAVHRLVSGLFVVEDRGAQALKGIERPVQLYRVVQASGVRGRLQAAAAARGLTRFVGREDDLRLLTNRWERALEGEGQMVLIIGEAGIGKSRLVQHFREELTGRPHTWAECAAAPFYQNTPFYAVTELLRQFLAWHGDESADAQLAQLESALELARLQPAETVPLLAPLLNLPLPARYPSLTISPEQQRRRLLATLVEWVLGSARAQPLVIATEDLHWADPSTLELIRLLVEQCQTARLLLLYTARSEFRPPWPPRAHHIQLTLNRLSAREVHTMVEEVAAQKVLSKDTVAAVVERTGGVPLFIEELTRAVLEGGDAQLKGRAIPATLHDSLMARLDRLGPAKEVIQIGAVIGGGFSYTLLHAVHPIPEADLQRALGSLINAELLYVRGIAPDANYQFKHALIRDTAYEALLKTRRRELHRGIANVIGQSFCEVAEAHPELLAHHYTEAGLTAQAIPRWQKAGQRASQQSAHVEAINHLGRGLELLATRPETTKRARQELMLQITLGPALQATKGAAAPEVERAYTRARELCQQVGETPQLFPVLWGLWRYHNSRAEFRTARELGGRLFTLAQSLQDPVLLLQAHHALWTTSFYRGELPSAHEHIERGMALYNVQQAPSHILLYGGHDPGACSQVMGALILWSLGYPDRALNKSHEALNLARELSHPYSLANTLACSALLHQIRREAQLTQGRAEAAVTLSIEQGFPFWLAWGTILQGWALAEQGQREEGVAQIRQGLTAYRAIGGEMMRSQFLALLAEGHGNMGQADEGLIVLAEALASVDKTGERRWEAELYRLRGELTLLQQQTPTPSTQAAADAEGYFHKAIGIARKQRAKSLELRARTSLARLWQRHGKRTESHKLLSEVYGWFTEGFDTADLKDARALLDELAN
jgi:predicted ATPase/class 3 adenylate cyclase/ribosomal protein L40E